MLARLVKPSLGIASLARIVIIAIRALVFRAIG